MRAKRGLSLVEVVICIGLFGLISTCIAALIRTGFDYLRKAEDRAELQRSSLFVMNRLSRELAESSPDCVRVASGAEPVGLVFASPRDEAGGVVFQDGMLQWQRWVCVYWDQPGKRLIQAEEPLAEATAFKPDPSPGGLDMATTHFVTLNSAQARILARNVSNFEVTGSREISISLQVQVNEGDRRSTLTTRTGVTPYH